MKDVALRAGVSIQTVSNLVNRRQHLMTGETRLRVEEAMTDLGYHPNMSARGLRSARTSTLGFLVLDPHVAFLADPLTDLLIAGAGDVARERGYSLLIHGGALGEPDPRFLAPVLESRVDGALVLLAGEEQLRLWYVKQLMDLQVEFVLFDQPMDDPSVSVVRAADRDAGRRLAAYLIAKGHRRIAFIAARVPWAVVEERHRGYREALDAAGIPIMPELELFEAGWEPAGGGEMALKVLGRGDPPTAIMCGSDVLALGALKALREAGLRVPEQVAVTGFDDFLFSEYIDPPLTTVKVPGYEMGRAGAEILIGRLEGDEPAERQKVLPVALCLRASA